MESVLKICVILLLVRSSLVLTDESDFFRDMVSAFPSIDVQHSYQEYCKYSWVICSSNATVFNIELENVQLHGKLPSSITELSDLRKLVISNCSIEVDWDDINKLKKLTTLILKANSFAGKIPTISAPVEHLDLSNNKFDQFPDAFPESLKEICLDRNKLSGDFSRVNFALKNLTMLKIRLNSLSGQLPEFITNSASLIHLDISYNKFMEFPDNFPISLQVLGLSNNKISKDFSLIDCSKYPNLVSLNAHANQLTGSIPECINKLETLLILNLARNKLSGDLSSIIFPSTLDMINLSHNRITGYLPDSIFNKKRMSYINLSHNKFTGNIPKIAFIESIKIINLSYNNLTGEIPDFSNATKLDELYLNNNNLEIYCREKFENTRLKPNACYLYNNLVVETDCRSYHCLYTSSNSVIYSPDIDVINVEGDL